MSRPVVRMQLDAPFEDCWVEAYTEVKMGTLLAVDAAVKAAFQEPKAAVVEAALAAAAPLVADHNLTDVETGAKLDLSFASMTAGQIKGVLLAVTAGMAAGGASPLAKRPSGNSLGLVSPVSPSRRGTRSIGSRSHSAPRSRPSSIGTRAS